MFTATLITRIEGENNPNILQLMNGQAKCVTPIQGKLFSHKKEWNSIYESESCTVMSDSLWPHEL